MNLFEYKPRQCPENETIKLIFVGKLAPKKGLNYLLAAFAEIVSIYPYTQLTIISQRIKTKNGLKEQERVLSQIKELGLESLVTIKYNLTEREIVQELHNAHIFVHPSITTDDGNMEGIPNALKEAMATGMPVVATKHAGIPELITHQKNGLLIPEKDVGALTAAISFYVDHPQLWERYGLAAQTTVLKKFNLYQQIKVQEEIYDSLLNCRS